MIVWVNGAFGAGKTTTCKMLVSLEPRLRHFDPEWVGYMVANNLLDHPVTDFQHHPSWRRLVPVVADEVMAFTGQHLAAAQSVLAEDYWLEMMDGLSRCNHDVLHVVLDADADTLHARINADNVEPESVRPWRHRHVDAFSRARQWLLSSADLVLDTTALTVAECANLILKEVAFLIEETPTPSRRRDRGQTSGAAREVGPSASNSAP